MSREPLLLHGSARPREGAWVGPEGGPLNCGAKSEVCGEQAGPVVPGTCDLPPRTAGSARDLEKGTGRGQGRGLGASAPKCCFGVPVGLPRRKGSRWELVGRVRWMRDCQPPTPREESGGREDPGWSPTAACAQKQGWGWRGGGQTGKPGNLQGRETVTLHLSRHLFNTPSLPGNLRRSTHAGTLLSVLRGGLRAEGTSLAFTATPRLACALGVHLRGNFTGAGLSVKLPGILAETAAAPSGGVPLTGPQVPVLIKHVCPRMGSEKTQDRTPLAVQRLGPCFHCRGRKFGPWLGN